MYTKGSLTLTGFKIGGQEGHVATNGAALGQGVYLAEDSDISLGYTRGCKKMIMAKVLLNEGDDYSDREVIVARRKEQVLPEYIIHFEAA